MNKYQKSLELLDSYLKNTSREKLCEMMKKVDQIQDEGPTLEDYLDDIPNAYSFMFDWQNMEPGEGTKIISHEPSSVRALSNFSTSLHLKCVGFMKVLGDGEEEFVDFGSSYLVAA